MIKTKKKNNFLSKIFGDYGKSSVQETFPFRTISKDGVAILNNGFYSKIIEFEDINYKLAEDNEKEIILFKYFKLLNSFDNTVDVQLCFVNETDSKYYFEEKVLNADKDDGFNFYRKELNDIILSQLNFSSKGVLRRKFIVITVKENNLQKARRKLKATENNIYNLLKQMDVNSNSLNGEEWIIILKKILNKGLITKTPKINWEDFIVSQQTIKDYISPQSLNFTQDKLFKIDNKFCQVYKLQIDATELEDNFLEKIIQIDKDIIVSISFQTVHQQRAIKQTKNLLTDLGKTKAEEQKKNIRSGFDMDLLPPDLIDNLEETKNLLTDLRKRNERFFLVTFTIMAISNNIKDLDEINFTLTSICREYSCELIPLYNQQEDGLISTLPLGYNSLNIKRGLTTSSLGIFVPFTSQELFQVSDDSLYYGYNAISSNIIFFDRKNLKAPNGLVLGATGSGKSFKSKREIVEVLLRTDDDIIIADPEREYNNLARTFKGQVIELSTTSTNFINPFDIDLENITSDTIKEKSLFIISLIEQIIGGIEGLSGKEISIIDRCVISIYDTFMQNPSYDTMPTFKEFYDLLLKQNEPEAYDIATRIEIYVVGSMNVFNNRTNININSRLTVFDIKELKGVLKNVGLLIIQDYVWNRVSNNRNQNKPTWYFIDEIHLLLKDPKTATYMVELWKRLRKYGGIPTGITQNVTDFLQSSQVENILKNSLYIVMLSQSSDDQEVLAKMLKISNEQLKYVTSANPGEGLIFYDGKIIPFKDKFNKNTSLYKLMTTKLGE